jgi:hypothetical protein
MSDITTPIGRLLKWAADRRMTQAALAARLRVTPQDITNWKRRGLPSTQYQAAAELFGRSLDELVLGAVNPPLTVPPFGGTQAGGSIAQQLSHPAAIIKPPTIAWGALMSSPALPELFCVTLPDDAMAPEFPKGCTVTFSTSEGPPRPRDAVLVRDGSGHLYFREFQQRTPSHFVAGATGGGLLPLDSQADGLEVVAICVGKWGRRG